MFKVYLNIILPIWCGIVEDRGRLFSSMCLPGHSGHLVLLELSVDQQTGLLVHSLCDGVGYRVVGLEPTGEGCAAILIIHILLGMSAQKNTTIK